MFDIERHRHEYHHAMYTIIPEIIPGSLCARLASRLAGLIDDQRVHLVDHEGQGTPLELDAGGRYFHYLIDGDGCREDFPELEGAYHTLSQLVAAITSHDVVVSPHPESDINIKAYPSGGGTIGKHLDTNGITVLIYLTTNTEGALRLQIEQDDPWCGTEMELADRVREERVLAVAGSMLLMQGRKIPHDCEPMEGEFKAVAIFNYYARGDTRRPGHFDEFVYHGRNHRPTTSGDNA